MTIRAVPAGLRLTGDGLVLREWTDDDLAALVELFDDPDVARRTPIASPFDLDAARRFLEDVRRDHAEGRRVHLAITTDGRAPKGEVLLNRVARSIGYGVGSAHRGQGLAARAVRLMTDYAHRQEGLPRVILEIEPDNHASAAVARAAGYRLTDEAPRPTENKGRALTLLTWAHSAP